MRISLSLSALLLLSSLCPGASTNDLDEATLLPSREGLRVNVAFLDRLNLHGDVSLLPTKPKMYQKPGNFRGEALIGADLFQMVKDEAGDIDLAPDSLQDDGSIKVQTTRLTKSSDVHIDKVVGKSNMGEAGAYVALGERIAFVSLNSNDDAYFDVDDNCVPIVEGSLVTFEGGRPHNTVVNKGQVSLAGPFHLTSMTRVCPDSGCPDEEPDGLVATCKVIKAAKNYSNDKCLVVDYLCCNLCLAELSDEFDCEADADDVIASIHPGALRGGCEEFADDFCASGPCA